MLPLRDTKLSDSLSVSPSRPAERLSASTKLAVGGVLWLVCSLLFSCWVQWHMQSAPQGQPAAQYPANVTASSAAKVADLGNSAPCATPLGFAVSHAGWQRFDKKLALELVDTLLAQALPKALPMVQWRLTVLPQAGGEGQSGHAGADNRRVHGEIPSRMDILFPDILFRIQPAKLIRKFKLIRHSIQ